MLGELVEGMAPETHYRHCITCHIGTQSMHPGQAGVPHGTRCKAPQGDLLAITTRTGTLRLLTWVKNSSAQHGTQALCFWTPAPHRHCCKHETMPEPGTLCLAVQTRMAYHKPTQANRTGTHSTAPSE